MYNDLAYAPFGEQYAAAGTTGVTNTSFARSNEDTVSNLYDAYFREYGIQGRWPSPDPAGIAAANPLNPQSWNRYAYAFNNPEILIDPSGLQSGPVLEPDTSQLLPWSSQELELILLIMQSAGLTNTSGGVVEEGGSLYYAFGGTSGATFSGNYDVNGIPIDEMQVLSGGFLQPIGMDGADLLALMSALQPSTSTATDTGTPGGQIVMRAAPLAPQVSGQGRSYWSGVGCRAGLLWNNLTGNGADAEPPGKEEAMTAAVTGGAVATTRLIPSLTPEAVDVMLFAEDVSPWIPLVSGLYGVGSGEVQTLRQERSGACR